MHYPKGVIVIWFIIYITATGDTDEKTFLPYRKQQGDNHHG